VKYKLAGVLIDNVFYANENSGPFTANEFASAATMWGDSGASELLRTISKRVSARESSYAIFQIGELFVIDGATWADIECSLLRKFPSIETAIMAVRFGWRPK
jgi:hypothetical protein